MKTDTSYEWINGQKPHLIKNCIRIQCNTENFVPILVPGLSTSSSSSLLSSTSDFLDRFHSVYSFGRETSRRIYVVRGEIDKTAVNIQARSFMARPLDEIGKKC